MILNVNPNRMELLKLKKRLNLKKKLNKKLKRKLGMKNSKLSVLPPGPSTRIHIAARRATRSELTSADMRTRLPR